MLTEHNITLVKRDERRERRKFAKGYKKKKYDDVKKGKKLTRRYSRQHNLSLEAWHHLGNLI